MAAVMYRLTSRAVPKIAGSLLGQRVRITKIGDVELQRVDCLGACLGA
jgi:hypothetical protein